MKPTSTLSTLLTCLILSASAAFVSSCRDYEPYNEQRLQDVAYTHEFERKFGKIDPEQTWDLFGQLSRRRHIGTRAGTDNQYYNDVIVTDPFVTNPSFPNIGSPSDTVWVTRADNQEYNKVLPEIGFNGSIAHNPNLLYEETNLGRVIQDFVATADEFYIAPVHWTTSGNDEIGIYWYTDDETEADRTIMGDDGELYWLVLKPIIRGKTHLRYQNSSNPNSTIYEISDSQDNCGYVFGQGADHLVSYRVHVQVPQGIPYYGFYMLNHNEELTQYSESKLNDHLSYSGFSGHDVSYVATFNIQRDIDADYKDNRDYLCFEDWIHTGDFDLNDLVFRVEGFDNQSVVDQTEVDESAILVCEDLKQFDFDFNDIVLDLNYTEEINRVYRPEKVGDKIEKYVLESTDTVATLTVTPLAAGGAYESTLSIDNSEWGEIHALLGETPALNVGSKNHQIINAGENFTDPHSTPMVLTKTKEIKELPDRILVNGQNKYPTYLSQLFAEGFFKIFSREDGNAVQIISSKPQTGTANGSYQEGYAPQMMLLPNYFEWPQEMEYINDAYTKFQDWVSDITKTDWIVNSQVPALITERGNIGPNDPTVPTPVDESIVLDPNATTGDITLKGTTYRNGVFINLHDLQDDSYDGATAKLHITYSSIPSTGIIILDANGNHILEHGTAASDGQTVVTYSISETKFKNALTADGIYIFSTNRNTRVSIPENGATIDIHNVSTQAHHKLYVNPLYMTFETMNTQQITASSSTGGNITFTSSDESVATVSSSGVVTPVAEGYCSIVVRTAESEVAGKTYKSSSERVSIEVITGTPDRVTLKLGPTQNIAGATGNLTNYALCTTGRDAMDSWNSARLTVTKTAGNNSWFRIETINGTVVGEAQQVNGSANFTLNRAALDACKTNETGAIYTFRIVHSENTYIQAAVLDKIN